jgi:hypothetical protein
MIALLPPMLRRCSLAALLLALLGFLSACNTLATFMGSQTIHIKQAQLLSRLATQFPMKNQVLGLFDVTAMSPRLAMLADSNRVQAQVDISAQDRLFRKGYTGMVGLSFGLRYEPSDYSIRLKQVRIDQIKLNGLPAKYNDYLTQLGAWLAEDRLQDFMVHRLTPEQLSQAEKWGLSVTDVQVTATGLSVLLQPKKSP